MGLLQWTVCLFLACENQLDAPTTISGVTTEVYGYEVYDTGSPEHRQDMGLLQWTVCLFLACENQLDAPTTISGPVTTEAYGHEVYDTGSPEHRQDTGLLQWAVCLFWACENQLDAPTKIAGVTKGYEVSGTGSPEHRQGCDLSGLWYNEVGSEAYLKVAPDGFIKGEYRTSVEYSYGAAGDGPSYIVGTSNEDGNIFGFSVLWKGYNTTSFTSWAGVCNVCDGQTVLKTSWVLESLDENQCGQRNKLTGENTFTRTEQRPGPRRADNTNNPRDFQKWYRTMERNWEI